MDKSEKQGVSRRAFIQAAIAVAGVGYATALGYTVYEYLAAPAKRATAELAVKEVELPGAEKLPSGSAMIFKFAGRPAILIHHQDKKWVALSAVCTHLGCTVQFEGDRNRIYCACHGGVYDAHTGANVSGPPPRPLKQFKVAVQPGKVVVSRA